MNGPPARRVVVTGVGIVCSLGGDVPSVRRALSEGRRGFAPVTLFEPGGASSAPVAEAAVPAAAPVPSAAGGRGASGGRRTRNDAFLEAAAAEALAGAGLAPGAALAAFGISVGGSNGGMPEAEAWFLDRTAEAGGPARARARSLAPILGLPVSCGADRLAAALGARGPRATNSTACSSSAAAIATAADWIRDGECDGAVAGGSEPLCRLTFSGFAALRLMDPAGCRPFHAERRGLTLGEGAALLVLEEPGRARARGAEILAEVLEHGASCDAHHMTACHPEGRGMEAAMREALERSGVAPGQVGYLNAHGTATPVNDAAEAKAVARVFGERRGPAVSSTKSMHGHLLGGGGAIEAAVVVLALAGGVLPPNAGCDRADPTLALDLITEGSRRRRVSIAASNSFGFGGGNVVLLFGAGEAV